MITHDGSREVRYTTRKSCAAASMHNSHKRPQLKADAI